MWSPGEGVVLLLLALLAVQTVRLLVLRARPGRRLRARCLRAARAEREAELLLERHGYCIEAVQPVARVTLEVDGQAVAAEVRADLLVFKGHQRFVAEVKSGQGASRIANRSTRRQLLEYRIAYDVDAVLLVDMDLGRIHRVEFPALVPRPDPGRAWLWAAAGALVGIVLTWSVLSSPDALRIVRLLASPATSL